jgi:uncharacterized protein YuzE
MKVEYDKDVDAAYIYVEYPIKDGEVKKTTEVNENIMLDFDAAHNLIGVEILNASKLLSKEVIQEAVAV